MHPLSVSDLAPAALPVSPDAFFSWRERSQEVAKRCPGPIKLCQGTGGVEERPSASMDWWDGPSEETRGAWRGASSRGVCLRGVQAATTRPHLGQWGGSDPIPSDTAGAANCTHYHRPPLSRADAKMCPYEVPLLIQLGTSGAESLNSDPHNPRCRKRPSPAPLAVFSNWGRSSKLGAGRGDGPNGLLLVGAPLR